MDPTKIKDKNKTKNRIQAATVPTQEEDKKRGKQPSKAADSMNSKTARRIKEAARLKTATAAGPTKSAEERPKATARPIKSSSKTKAKTNPRNNQEQNSSHPQDGEEKTPSKNKP